MSWRSRILAWWTRPGTTIVLLAIIALAAGLLAHHGLDALANARAQRAALQAVMSAPPPSAPALLADGVAMVARNQTGAEALLLKTLRESANKAGVLVEVINGDGKGDAMIASARLQVSGRETAVLHLLSAIEQHRPVMRFAGWRLTRLADGSGALRLEGRVVAGWEAR